jgi:hypothetical protein
MLRIGPTGRTACGAARGATACSGAGTPPAAEAPTANANTSASAGAIVFLIIFPFRGLEGPGGRYTALAQDTPD